MVAFTSSKTTRACDHCHVCSQIAGERENDLIARLLPGEPYRRRVMLESPSFAAIPSLGPLAEGHTLLCPKQHIRSFAQVDVSLEAEFLAIKAELIELIGRIYGGEVHLFEHGMARDGDRVVCTVDHAHLHLVPVPSAFDSVIGLDPAWMQYDGSLGVLSELAGAHEYLMYETPDSRCRLRTSAEGGFESQHMRKLFAGGLSLGERWDWRESPNAAVADLACKRIATTYTGAHPSDRHGLPDATLLR